VADFYDDFADLYHLIFEDWNASIERQGQQLAQVIQVNWPDASRLLDVSCGIGTQAIALAKHGFHITASDLSSKSVKRAGKEAEARALNISFSVCDMRQAFAQHGTGFDVVISCDNSVPHLLSDEDILTALEQMYLCLKPGGGCLVTVRDYEVEARGKNIVKPYGQRIVDEKRYIGLQVWDFEGEHYNLTVFFIEEDLTSREVHTHVFRTKYYAVTTSRLLELMKRAGFEKTERLDNVFYQPVLIGTKPVR
jgi:SAM-dependent methyltransferase